MKRLLFPLLLLLAGLGIYFSIFKKKATSTIKTNNLNQTGNSNVLTGGTGGGTGTGGTGGGTGTGGTGGGTGTGGTGGGTGTGGTGGGATLPQGNTYEGGQTVYSRFNGNPVPVRGIGFLVDGTILTFDNTEYRDGEYKMKVVIPVNVGGLIGSYIVNGTSQPVYSTKDGIYFWAYLGAIGYLSNGAIVYQVVINAGLPNESTYYRT